jgi:hypothetical protein
MQMLRLSLGVGCLVAALVIATTAHAQVVVLPDFGGQIQPTLPTNQLLVGQILEALPTSDLALISEQAALTLGVGEELEQQLTLAMSTAPDEAARSRLEGVLTHTRAALDSLRQAQMEATVDSARGRLEQARGEAQEGLDELRPFVLALVDNGVVGGK